MILVSRTCRGKETVNGSEPYAAANSMTQLFYLPPRTFEILGASTFQIV
jgi:hypothetical protein